MRTLKMTQFFLALLALVAIVGCDKTETPKTPEQDKALIKVEITDKSDTSLTATITSTDVDKVAWMCFESDATLPSDEEVFANGTEIEAGKSVTIVAHELNANTEYTIVATAQVGDKYITVSKSDSTLRSAASCEIKEAYTATITTLTFNVASSNAEKVYYLCTEGSQEADTDSVIADGTEIEANKEVEVKVENLSPETEYNLYAVATNVDGVKTMASLSATTNAGPSINLTINSADINSITFLYTATNAEAVKYICIEKGSRDLSMEQIFANGIELSPNATDEVVTIDGLKENTAYEIHAVAKAEGLMAEANVIYEQTLIKRTTLVFEAEQASVQIDSTKTNFYITLVDSDSNTLYLDLYTNGVNDYLPTGDYYNTNEDSGNYFNMQYTRLFSDDKYTTFQDGFFAITATPDTETRNIDYNIIGNLVTEEGDFEVAIYYSGSINGMMLPAVAPDAPEGAYIFDVSPETSAPVRIAINNEKSGEYYIKFYNREWGELVMDIYADPAECDNGAAALPAGNYTIDNGGLSSTHTSITLYNPYYGGEFTTGELNVTADDSIYTFTFLGTAINENNGEEKVVYMKWTGEIKDMVR